MIEFKNNEHALTLGVELEFQVLDNTTLQLTPRTHEILDQTKLTCLSKEFFQSTIELITPVSNKVQEVEAFCNAQMSALRKEASSLGITFAGTGTHPTADYRERLITPNQRYHSLVNKTQWLIRRMAVYGMHVHIGLKDGNQCIHYLHFFMQMIPHLLALSSSSPFWRGMNTHLASCRPTMYEALPTAGIPYEVDNWKNFQQLVDHLVNSKSIVSCKDLWWDVRPSPNLGTIEIRICDGSATEQEMLGIISFIHALAFWFRDNQDYWIAHDKLDSWCIRENKWRAIRYGLDGEIISSNNGNTILIRDSLESWLERLDPYYKDLQYGNYEKYLKEIIERGNSSDRQKRMYDKTESIEEVMKLNVREFEQGKPEMI